MAGAVPHRPRLSRCALLQEGLSDACGGEELELNRDSVQLLSVDRMTAGSWRFSSSVGAAAICFSMLARSALPDKGTDGKLRRGLVRDLGRRSLIRSEAVRDAFLAVPRELFLREFAAREGLAAVYRDEAIPTKFDGNGFAISSSSQPAIMAEMLEQLTLEPGMHVLEIGAGTGYNAALLAHIVGKKGSVTAVEVDRQIARSARAALRESGYRVRVVTGDGLDGVAAQACGCRKLGFGPFPMDARHPHRGAISAGLRDADESSLCASPCYAGA